MSDDNVFVDEWDTGEDWSGGGALSKRLARGDVLGATVYELGPGNFVVYHRIARRADYVVRITMTSPSVFQSSTHQLRLPPRVSIRCHPRT